jgi:hypothetical protein
LVTRVWMLLVVLWKFLQMAAIIRLAKSLSTKQTGFVTR